MYGEDILNICTKDEKWAIRSTVLCKYSEDTQLITITNTEHWYWQMVKLLETVSVDFLSWFTCSFWAVPLGQGKIRKKQTKKTPQQQTKNQTETQNHPKTNKQTNKTTKNPPKNRTKKKTKKKKQPPTKEDLKSSPLSVYKYCHD